MSHTSYTSYAPVAQSYPSCAPVVPIYYNMPQSSLADRLVLDADHPALHPGCLLDDLSLHALIPMHG